MITSKGRDDSKNLPGQTQTQKKQQETHLNLANLIIRIGQPTASSPEQMK